MKKQTMNILITTLLILTSAGAAHAENLLDRPYISAQLYGGQINLEGPAVTGDNDDSGDDESGYGIRLEGLKPIGERYYAKGRFDWSVFADEFQLYHLSAAAGVKLPLFQRDTWSLNTYLQGGVEFVKTEDLNDIAQEAPYAGRGNGEDGDDLGFSGETGITATFNAGWEAGLYATYMNFGDGDGPGFGARIAYTINEDWTALASWDGLWVEDAGYNIDLAHQGIHLGVARKF